MPTLKQVTVTGNLNDQFQLGRVLTDKAEIIAYYRDLANEGRDTPIELTDDVIWSWVNKVEGDSDKAEMERVTLIENVADEATVTGDEPSTGDETTQEETGEETTGDDDDDKTPVAAGVNVSAVTAVPHAVIKQRASAIAARLQGNTAFMAELKADMDAGERLKRGPLSLMIYLRQTFKPEEMSDWPLLGTHWKKGDNNPEKMKSSVFVDGEWKDKTIGFYETVFSLLPEGKKLDQEIEAIRRRKTDNSSPYHGQDDDVCNSQKKSKEARRTSGRQLVRRAAGLHLQFTATKRDLPEIACSYLVEPAKDQNGKIIPGKKVPSNSTYPIVIKETKPAMATEGDETPTMRSSVWSITQFLAFKVKDALDPQKVKEKGSVYSAFVGSTGKGSGDEGNDKAMDIDTFAATAGLMAGYASDHLSLIRKRMKDDIATMQSVCRMALELHGLYEEFKLIFDAAEAGQEARARAMLANRNKLPNKNKAAA